MSASTCLLHSSVSYLPDLPLLLSCLWCSLPVSSLPPLICFMVCTVCERTKHLSASCVSSPHQSIPDVVTCHHNNSCHYYVSFFSQVTSSWKISNSLITFLVLKNEDMMWLVWIQYFLHFIEVLEHSFYKHLNNF